MVIEAEEAEQFAALADALLINVGTLTAPRAQSMRRAIESAVAAAGTPWVLDPVAVGALAYPHPILPANIVPQTCGHSWKAPPKSSPLPE